MTPQASPREGPTIKKAPAAGSSSDSPTASVHQSNTDPSTTPSRPLVLPRPPAAVDLDAERAVCTSIMLRPEIAGRVAAIVDVADLAHPDHAAVYSALLGVVADVGTVDGPSLRAALRSAGSPLADDVLRLGAIVDAPDVSSWCARRHAQTVADLARRRRVRSIGLELADDASDVTRPIDHSIALAVEALRGAP